MNKNKDREKSVSIRFPLNLLEELKNIAQKNERSLNGEVLISVREHITKENQLEVKKKDTSQ